MWFTPENVVEVTWAGKPDKLVVVEDGVRKQVARDSFKPWCEVVRGKSAPWTATDLAVRDAVSSFLNEMALRDAVIKIRKHRMYGKNAGALESRLSRFISEQLSGHAMGWRFDVRMRCADCSLLPHTAVNLKLAFAELLNNAKAHGAFLKVHGKVHLEVGLTDGVDNRKSIYLHWAEFKGAEVPFVIGLDGDGMVLLKHVLELELELELDCSVDMEFNHSGMVCRIEIPVEGNFADFGTEPSSERADKRLLLINHDGKVASELRTCLTQERFDVMSITASVKDGMHRAAQEDFDFALLDATPCNEKAWPLAHALTDMQIPFAFARESLLRSDVPSRFSEVPVLKKPYRVGDISKLVASYL